MKQKLKATFFFTILMSFILSCDNESQSDSLLSEDPDLKTTVYITSKVSQKEMGQNTLLNSKLSDLMPDEGLGANKLVFSDDNEFFIDTDDAIYLESPDGSYHSYTFALVRTNGLKTFENLLLSLNSENTYSTFIVSYSLTEIEKQNLLDGIDVDLTDKVAIQPISNINSDEIFNKTIYVDQTNGVLTCWEENYGSSQGTGWEVINYTPVECPWDPSSGTGSGPSGNAGGQGQDGGDGNTNTGTNGGYVYTSNAGFGAGGTAGNGTYSQGYTGPATSPYILTWEQRLLLDFKGSLNSEQRSFMSTHPDIKLDIHLFLLNNTSQAVDLGSSTPVNTQMIALEVINIMISNPFMDLDEAFENYLLNNSSTLEDAYFVEESDDPIEDIENYLSCFDTSEGATVTIYADQPDPDNPNRDSWLGDVGHSFITITQGSNQASFGFYPASGIGYFSPTDGTMEYNEEHAYDVSITIGIQGNDLNTLITHSIDFANTDYSLQDVNCTSFAISSANIVGFNIPLSSCIGQYTIGEGATPAAFGEYIRNMNLPQGSTRNPNGGTAPLDNNCD